MKCEFCVLFLKVIHDIKGILERDYALSHPQNKENEISDDDDFEKPEFQKHPSLNPSALRSREESFGESEGEVSGQKVLVGEARPPPRVGTGNSDDRDGVESENAENDNDYQLMAPEGEQEDANDDSVAKESKVDDLNDGEIHESGKCSS